MHILDGKNSVSTELVPIFNVCGEQLKIVSVYLSRM